MAARTIVRNATTRTSDAAHDRRELARLQQLEARAGALVYHCSCRATRTAAWVAWWGSDCVECGAGRLEAVR